MPGVERQIGCSIGYASAVDLCAATAFVPVGLRSIYSCDVFLQKKRKVQLQQHVCDFLYLPRQLGSQALAKNTKQALKNFYKICHFFNMNPFKI
jgi:hypothetical protein